MEPKSGYDDKMEPMGSRRVQKELEKDNAMMMRDIHKMWRSERKITIEHFIHEDSLFEMLVPAQPDELAPCALLDGQWMMRRAERLSQCTDREERRQWALPCRQQLERDAPEAFMQVDKLRQLERGDSRINSPLRLVCVSHAWCLRGHPDPYGDNLLVLAEALIRARAAERFPDGDFAVFMDWVSLHQRDENGVRTSQEKVAFRQALSKMNLWYAHQKTLVYLLSATPSEWAADTIPYHARGWTSFERSTASWTFELSDPIPCALKMVAYHL